MHWHSKIFDLYQMVRNCGLSVIYGAMIGMLIYHRFGGK